MGAGFAGFGLLCGLLVQVVLLPRVRQGLQHRRHDPSSLRRQGVQGLFPTGRMPGLPDLQANVASRHVPGTHVALYPVSPPLLRAQLPPEPCSRQPIPLSNDQNLPDCWKTYEVKYKKGRPSAPRHRCGWATCSICDQRVDVANHRCFIQPIDPDDDLSKTKKLRPAVVGTRAVVGEPNDDGYVEVEREPPLLVFADYEALTEAEGVQTAILIGYEKVESEDAVLPHGQDCTARFIEAMEELAVDSEGDDRRVIVLFHNLKSYDGMCLLQYLYRVHRDVTDQITVGTKILSFTSDRLTFKDSLRFLSRPSPSPLV